MSNSARSWIDTQYPHDARLVVLHPNYDNQHLVLPALLAHRKRAPLMVTLQRAGSDLNTVLAGLVTALQEQADQPLGKLDARLSAKKAAQFTLEALQPIAPYALYIDSCDLAEDTSVVPWLAAMVGGVPKGSQIVLITRRMPVGLYEALVETGVSHQAALYPVDEDRMLIDYLAPHDRRLLEVYAHGPGRAYVDGRLIDQWDGLLPRLLFFYLIDRGMTTRDEIFGTFWPTLSVREATNVFHVTKRKISELLGFDLTVYGSGFYRIAPDIDLRYDVVKFGEYAQNSAVEEGDTAIAMLEHATYLYRGPFLNNIDVGWVNNRREDLSATHIEALASLAKLYEDRGDGQRALGLYSRALALQPFREDLVRAAMLILKDLGHPDRALEMYDNLAGDLKRVLNVNPDPQTSALVDQMRRKPGRSRR